MNNQSLKIDDFYLVVREESQRASPPYLYLKNIWIQHFLAKASYQEFLAFINAENKRYKILYADSESALVKKRSDEIGMSLRKGQTMYVENIQEEQKQ